MTPLSSPAAASSAFGLIEPCPVSRPRPTRPQPASVTTLAVALVSVAGSARRWRASAPFASSPIPGSSATFATARRCRADPSPTALLAHHYDELAAEGFSGEAINRTSF